MMNLVNMVKGLAMDMVASRIIENWEHDKGTLKFWRASSNFVYVFAYKNKKYFLRFCHEEENSIEQINAELSFLEYLKSRNYSCASPVLSIHDKYVEQVVDQEENYFAVVFQSAEGITLDEGLTEEQGEKWGQSLALLHQLSKEYKPSGTPRVSWQDILLEIENTLKKYPDEVEATQLLAKLTKQLQSLSFSTQNYGLIHYDFQLDNVFYDKNTNSFNVIDFDDAFYSWYVQDIVTALDDFIENDTSMILSHPQVSAFLKGYGSIVPLSQDELAQLPYFRKFMKLYQFTRLLRSLENADIPDAPDWLVNLKVKLAYARDEIRSKELDL